MLLFALLAIQTAVALAAGVWFWRRLESQHAEIAELREALAAKGAKRAKVAGGRGASADVIPIAMNSQAETAPAERAQRAWNLPATPTFAVPTAGVSVETARGLTLGRLNEAPIADAGPGRPVELGASFVLSGARSRAGLGRRIASYRWTWQT